MFTNKQLIKLLIPIIIEQLLVMAVGLVDSIMVSSCGETAISAVSLINSINYLIIMIISALAAGGSIVTAHAIGRKDDEGAALSTGQLMLMIGIISFILGLICFVLNRPILNLLYPTIEDDLMENAVTYFFYSALSYPFLGIYNGGASLFRAAGNSKISMYISLMANLVNIIGNAILIYALHMGVAGAAIATLVSRIVSAVVVMYCFIKRSAIPFRFSFKFNIPVIKEILSFGIPSGIEDGISQIGKLLVSTLSASFGTVAITADSVTCNIGNIQIIPSTAIVIAMITVVGQAYGADNKKGIISYTKKLCLTSHIALAVLGLFLFLFKTPLFNLYSLSPEVLMLSEKLLTYNIIMLIFFHPGSFAVAAALRAIGDVKFTMYISLISLWTVRVFLSYFLGRYFGLGIFGVWIAMSMDWVVRTAFFVPRFIKKTKIKEAS